MKITPINFTGPRVAALLGKRKTQTRRLVKESIDFIGPGGCDGPNRDDPTCWGYADEYGDHYTLAPDGPGTWALAHTIRCPYGAPGDLLYVKEPWRLDAVDDSDGTIRVQYRQTGDVSPRLNVPDADMFNRWWEQSSDDCEKAGVEPGDDELYCWQPGKSPLRKRHARFLPRWASRITLELTEVRVQRVCEISEEDAIAEGCKPCDRGTWWQGYRELDNGELMHQQSPGDKPPAWMIEPKRLNTSHLDTTAAQSFAIDWRVMHGTESWDHDWVWALSFTVHLANVNTVAAKGAAV